MQRWEYAQIDWEGDGMGKHRQVVFTHQEPWTKLRGDELMQTFTRLGDEGWELVAYTVSPRDWSTWWFKRPVP